jgi:alpha,alpha-trehalase
MPSLRHAVLVALALAAALLAGACSPPSDPAERVPLPAPERIRAVEAYIDTTWSTLTRSHDDLLEALPDEKVEHEPGTPWPLYIAVEEDSAVVLDRLQDDLTPDELAQVDIRRLPANARLQANQIEPHGLLYLPHPYVVPGGRFNEMYGWDSYFIQVGLLRDGRVELAKHMIDNHLYQVQHYGAVLNANRTYYLTRSQPPFLTTMILEVYQETQDREWLESTVPAIETYYDYWTQGEHQAGTTGLSRYYGLGEGPAPEVVMGERDAAGLSHYDRVRQYYAANDVQAYPESLYYDASADELTPLFYKGDRSMRESGFDPSNRFGPFNIDIIHHAPVGLNALLYKMEMEATEIYSTLGFDDEAATWRNRAAARKERVDEYLWNEDTGLYHDYDFREEDFNPYAFATTFYPLWVGLASEEQAQRVRANLYQFEAPGGLLTSTTISGNQWDAPFGWAPLHLIAVEGLRNYGYDAAADRLTAKFVETITKEFEEHGVILEKYDMVQRESDVAAGIQFGYSENVIGFGWTNAVFIELLAAMD